MKFPSVPLKMADIINIEKKLEKMQFENLVSSCKERFPNDDLRVITEIVTGFYRRNKDNYDFGLLKEKTFEEVGSQLLTYRSAFPAEKFADIIPLKKNK